MEAWIQKHDFTTDSLSDGAQDHGLELLSSFDWEAELAKYEEALDEKRDRCPPGMGFVDDDRVLHVMPIHDGKSHYNYSCDHPVRLFSIFGASKSLNAWAIPDEHRQRIIGLHYAGEQEQLVRTLVQLSQDISKV
ncbi:MAG: hypothetical protein VCA34_14995 [Roseibacillus sp.]